MKSSKPDARISFRLMLGLGLASYFTAGLIYAQVAGVRAYNNSGARHVDSNGTPGGGGGTGPGGGGPPNTPPPTTIQAAFRLEASGKEVKANCAVCHSLSIQVGSQTLTSGQAGTFKLGKNYPVRIIDNPQTSRPSGTTPPDHDTAKFTVWPEAVDGQTITKTADDKAFVVSKNGVLQYIIDNQESLFAQDKSWDKNLLKKKGALVPVQIQGVSFGGTKYWELKSDDAATLYSAPQWKDVDGDGNPTNTAQGERNYAVAFTRNTKPKIGAKFKITNASNLGTLKIKATGPGGVAIPETTATVSGDDVTLPIEQRCPSFWPMGWHRAV